ncbi:MAG: GntR family transcriptional regulator [Proteobacteria bacterium]|nr:GntR family transcriptional regulator [Pseudomonadota bacterium]
MQAMRHDGGNNSTLNHFALVMISLSDILAIPNLPGGVFGFSGGAAVRKRLGGALFSFVDLERSSPVPLFRHLAARIRQAVHSGRLASGSRRPSGRVLATELGVSRTMD